MIDSLREHLPRAVAPAMTLEAAGLSPAALDGPEGYGVVTLHRPSNVDTRDALGEALEILRDVSKRLPLAWPVHPRARANIARFGFDAFPGKARIALLPPQGYLEMLGLLAGARVVLTDSGGIQEETTALAVPCLTVRDSTERPITVSQGTNSLVKRDRAAVGRALDDIFETGGKRGRVPELWDGHAAPRIASHLAGWLASRGVAHDRASIGAGAP
jgi:UDP-N-acetylglucosamine 2-epimerase (non-hydrolysing)